MQLLAAYKNIVMPNLRLSKSDADNVLGYFEEVGDPGLRAGRLR